VEEIESKNRELFQKLKKQGLIPRNQGYKNKSHIAYGILTLSYEAQKEIEMNSDLRDKFLARAREYLHLLADALGTDLLYAILHEDETAPHIHFTLRNLRYKIPSPEAIRKLGWEDLTDTLKQGLGKAVTNTFYGSSFKANNVRPYMIHYSRLQDTLKFFEPFGFGRGTPKKVREARGEPYWKTVYRNVRQLHEDLPKEIKLKRIELDELKEYVYELEERKTQLENQLRVLQAIAENLKEELKDIEDTIRLKEENRKLKEEIEKLRQRLLDHGIDIDDDEDQNIGWRWRPRR
jgi:hypothetical protein